MPTGRDPRRSALDQWQGAGLAAPLDPIKGTERDQGTCLGVVRRVAVACRYARTSGRHCGTGLKR